MFLYVRVILWITQIIQDLFELWYFEWKLYIEVPSIIPYSKCHLQKFLFE